MYRHCLFCAAGLGSNRAIEELPVGRRLAFDPAKGRLWVVCGRCERWNLSPLDERWEALEALERRYRDVRTRVSTENIGLARLDEGLELVRVGKPRRPEFAAWRYGDQFGRRRKRFITSVGLVGGLAVGLGIGSAALAGASTLVLPLHLWNLARVARSKIGAKTRIHASDGRLFELEEMEVGQQKLRPSPDHEGGWCLDMTPWLESGVGPGGRVRKPKDHAPDPLLTGPDAVHALSIILPRLNSAGGGRGEVQKAVGLIEEAGSPEGYFREVELHARRRGYGYNPLRGLPKELRLGLEMAAHEDQERAALEGELALLEEAWKEAEAIAAIADDLMIPGRVRSTFRKLTDRSG